MARDQRIKWTVTKVLTASQGGRQLKGWGSMRLMGLKTKREDNTKIKPKIEAKRYSVKIQ